MKVCTIIGARPQFVKAAAVSRALQDAPKVTETLVHTGQHYDANLSAVSFDALDIARSECLLEDATQYLIVVDPLEYLAIVTLERSAWPISSDLGAMQKEVFI